LNIVIPRNKFGFLPQKKASSMEQTDLKHMFKQTSRSAHTSSIVSPDPLSFFQLWRL